ncbi:MAG: hypothetical protein U0840_11055 [Gemmataceae bacterium]
MSQYQFAASGQRPSATIRIQNQQLVMDESLLAVVGPLLTYDFLPVHGADCTLESEVVLENMLAPARPRPNGGLAPVVAYRLLQRGYTPQLQCGVRSLPEPTLTEALCWYCRDRPLLDFVRHNSHGLIHRAPGVSPIQLLAQLCLAWPNQRFVIATGSHAEAKQLRKKLYELYRIQSSLVTPTLCPENPRRIVVGTYISLAHGQIECNQRDFFIAYDAWTALSVSAQLCLTQVDSRFRLFGFVSALDNRPPWDQDLLHATFGFERLVIPQHHCEAVAPRVLWIPFRSKITVDSGLRPLSLKRRCVWNHAHRNRWIARLANLLAEDPGPLQNVYPDISEFLQTREITRIVLLTENDEHASMLARRLKDWRYLTYPAVRRRNFEQPMAPALPEFSPREHVILSCQVARDYPLPCRNGLTVVVWAGADAFLPPLPSHWLKTHVGMQRELLVIDLCDQSQPDLRKWSRHRQLGYQRAEWLAPGLDLFTERIKAFLRSRPGGNAQ